MGRIEDKILDILKEGVEYENLGGPTPSQTLQGPIDYAKNVQRATVPQARPIPGVGTTGSGEADQNEPITDIEDDLAEDEDMDDDHDSDDDDKKKKDDKDDDKEDLEETFASLLARLAEEDDEMSEDEDMDEPKVTLPDVDSMLEDPDSLATPGLGPVAEDEDEDMDEPKVTLPDVDSMLEDPDSLATPAPGVQVAEDEEDGDDDKDDDDKDDEEDDEKKKKEMDEDIRAIFSGIKLSEGAKLKAATIFSAALTRRVTEEKERVERIATKKLKEAYNVLKSRTEKKTAIYENKLTGQVDRYLNYVVENWMKENRLAVERGIRAELAEDFILGLKNLFIEHYIEVPESKVDVVATLGKKVTKLESKLNESVETNVKLRSAVNAYRKEEVVRAVAGNLPETQREKLAKLAEGVEFTTRKEFADKLNSLRESYFPKTVKTARKEEPLFEEATTPNKNKSNSEMSVYATQLSKFKKN